MEFRSIRCFARIVTGLSVLATDALTELLSALDLGSKAHAVLFQAIGIHAATSFPRFRIERLRVAVSNALHGHQTTMIVRIRVLALSGSARAEIVTHFLVGETSTVQFETRRLFTFASQFLILSAPLVVLASPASPYS